MATQTRTADGIHAMLPRELMAPGARKLRDTYAVTPGAPLYQREFGFYCLERWYEQGLSREADLAEEFGYDPPGSHRLGGLGWCEAAFSPAFEEKVLEDRGEYELVQDFAGRAVLCFKGRRSGFMPEYVSHPVTDMRSWNEDVKWRLDPSTPERAAGLEQRLMRAREAAGRGMMISQGLVGGYMYLRSLIGPEGLLYAFCEQPDLVHDCMQAWFALADAVIACHQEHLTLDEIFIGEDICFNHGPLISPEMIREFLFPYYRQLLTNARRRQLDPDRRLYFQVDTDGFCDPVIDLYRELGMDTMSPFEVAAGCDVVRTGRCYPDMALFGGFDKRVLAAGTEAIDREVARIFPLMRERGGYIPTCDHGVPEEVSLENYRHFRARCREFGA
ncbi:MAG: hypothetical protein GF331_27050 [Chitinivibrionales bacterium]|nr:hypothetical protein [Chitinivibrionales bacterium]